MKEIGEINVQRLPNGVIDSQYYLEKSRAIRAKAFQKSLRQVDQWLKKQVIRAIDQAELISERHKTHKKCEQ